jgi:hypothetical protein
VNVSPPASSTVHSAWGLGSAAVAPSAVTNVRSFVKRRYRPRAVACMRTVSATACPSVAVTVKQPPANE